jgi:Family of unknown function (DUF5343)
MEAFMPVTSNAPAPYAPSGTILEIVRRHRDRGLPKPINAETLQRAGLVSESLTPRTLQALTNLDLIDDSGAPTAVFEGIRLAPEAEYKKRLEDWLKAAYADVFSFVDPSKDDATLVRDAFRGYQPTGQQDRMLNLFLGLCAAAGLSPEKQKNPVKKSTGNTIKPKVGPITARPKPKFQEAPQSTTDLPPALAGLLASLPKNGMGWTQEKRDKFAITFSAVLDFVFPIVETEQTDSGVDL